MSHYGQYRGRSVGRVLHCLEIYTKYHRIDETQVGDGAILLNKKLFAEYTWPDTPPTDFDTPTFDWEIRSPKTEFQPYDLFNESTIALFEKNQAILQPFVDDVFLRDLATWLVQQVRDQISFSHALLIRFVRDRLKGDWDDLAYSPKKGEWTPQERITKILYAELAEASVYAELAEASVYHLDIKIKMFISGKPYEESLSQFVKDYWKHFALCAVLDI